MRSQTSNIGHKEAQKSFSHKEAQKAQEEIKTKPLH
jgi:hypothetical protein